MSRSSDRELDRLLRTWAAATAPDDRDLEAMRQRISEQLADRQEMSTPCTPRVRTSRARMWPGAAMTAAAVAALLLLTLGVRSLLVNEMRVLPITAQNGTLPEGIRLSPADLENRRRVLVELQSVFEQQVVWMFERAGEMNLGLATAGAARKLPPERFVAIRLSVVSRPAADRPWTLLETIDVIAGQQEAIQLIESLEQESEIYLWVYPLDDGLVSIDLRGTLPFPRGAAISSSELHKPGQLSKIHNFRRNGVEYRVYQAAAVLIDRDLS